MGENKKVIVVSAIALRSGGPLTIVQEALEYLDNNLTTHYQVKALVSSESVYQPKNKGMDIIPVKNGERYLTRLMFEYITFKKWSKQWQPELWLSLHDISPRVHAKKQAVYCHNPSPFYKASLKDLRYSPTVFIFSLFYKYFYRLNISSNSFIVVQQSWIRTAFKRMFPISGDVVVAYPEQPPPLNPQRFTSNSSRAGITVFVYPAFPRIFKNHEVLLRAFELIERSEAASSARLVLTIDGSENTYSADLVKRYGHLDNVEFVGLLPRSEVMDLMAASDCLLFPSKLETWGLPISEAKSVNLPMLVADLPYAHETVSNYDAVRFFGPDDYEGLSSLITDFCEGRPVTRRHEYPDPAPPFTKSWEDLFTYLLEV